MAEVIGLTPSAGVEGKPESGNMKNENIPTAATIWWTGLEQIPIPIHFLLFTLARWPATSRTSIEFSLSSAMHKAKLEEFNLPFKDVEPT